MTKRTATKALKVDGRWYRISAQECAKHNMPPHEWLTIDSKDLLVKVGANIEHRVPLNHKLVENLRNEPVRNPVLCGPDYWPWVGSQRIRALYELNKEGITYPILVCRITRDPLSIWSLWGGNEGKRCQAIQVQLYELLFKSMFYPSEKTIDGRDMFEFEKDGDKLYWSVRDDNPAWKDYGKEAREKILKGDMGDVKNWDRTD